MCEAASGVNTKDAVLWIPQFNSHNKILEHFGIEDTKPIPDFVKWECTPPIKNGIPDYNAPLDQWVFKIDQDRLPSWAVPKLEEKRARKVLPDWYKSHIEGKCTDANYVVLTGGDHATVTGGNGATVTGGYGATVTGGDYATVTGGNGATVTGGDYATVTGGHRSTVTGGNGAIVTGGYHATVTGGNRATVTGGYGAVLIVRWYDNEWKTLTKTITKQTAGNTYQVVTGKWKCIRKAQGGGLKNK